MSHKTFHGVLRIVAIAAAALSASACMTEGAARKLDARFEAGWRPGPGYCAYGGETALLDAYCARVNFGDEGAFAVLKSVNAGILQAAAGHSLPCTEHVAQAREHMAPYAAEFRTEEVYSCDRDPAVVDGRKVCHVSLLVTDRLTGRRWVMDNGHVLDPQTTAGVGQYGEFAGNVAYAWTNDVPAWIALGTQ